MRFSSGAGTTLVYGFTFYHDFSFLDYSSCWSRLKQPFYAVLSFFPLLIIFSTQVYWSLMEFGVHMLALWIYLFSWTSGKMLVPFCKIFPCLIIHCNETPFNPHWLSSTHIIISGIFLEECSLSWNFFFWKSFIIYDHLP